jgi:hypothetical protein
MSPITLAIEDSLYLTTAAQRSCIPFKRIYGPAKLKNYHIKIYTSRMPGAKI